MTETTEFNYEGVEQLPLKEFTEKACLDYSMYVIMNRALPHTGDGLKPVQRRIVYATPELGLKVAAKRVGWAKKRSDMPNGIYGVVGVRSSPQATSCVERG